MKKILLLILIFHSRVQAQQSAYTSIDSLLPVTGREAGPGFSIGIVKNGALSYHKYAGMANLEYNIPISDSSVFGLASLSKQFTAACIWVLIEQKKISLEDDIRQYLPEFPDYGTTIKIRHLLNHTSGIRNYHTLMDLSGFDYDKQYHTNADILALACRQKGLNNKPGEKVLYGNTGYTLLAIIIERISGENLNSFAQKNLFQPLGMKQTRYITDYYAIIPNRAYGYAPQNGGYLQFPRNQVTYGAGSMVSTIKDLAIWAEVLMRHNSAYKQLASFLTTQEVLPMGDTAEYARGLMTDRYKGYKTIHHSGFASGGQTQMLTIPELGTSVIILTNDVSINPGPLSYKVMDELLPNAAARYAAQPKKSRDKVTKIPDQSVYAGTYIELNSDMRMDIIKNGDSLYARGAQAKQAVALTPLSNGSFCRRNNETVKYTFPTEHAREYDMSISFGGTPFYFKKVDFVAPASVRPEDFSGKFYSEELSATYDFKVEDNKLLFLHPLQGAMILTPTVKDAFGNGARVSYQFLRDDQGKVYAMLLAAEGTVKDIRFTKQ